MTNNLRKNFFGDAGPRPITLRHHEQEARIETETLGKTCMPPAHMSRPLISAALLPIAFNVPAVRSFFASHGGGYSSSPRCV